MTQILPPLTPITTAPGVPEPRPTPMAGDVIGSTLASTVAKVEGNPFEPVTYGSEQDGYAFIWVNKDKQIEAKSISHPAVWDQTEWYVDPISGNDTNNGLTLATAIKTVSEYRRRVGPVHEISRNIVMHIMSSLPVTDSLDLSGIRSVGYTVQDWVPFSFTVIGHGTVVASGVATVRQPNTALNIPHGMSCATIGSLAPYVFMGTMIQKTSGLQSTDSVDPVTLYTTLATSMWLAKDEDGVTARMSWPAYLDDWNFSNQQCDQGTFTTGDTFDIVNLCQIPIVTLPPHGLWADIRFERCFFTCDSLTYVEATGQTFIQCAIRTMISIGVPSTATDCQIGAIFGTTQPSSSCYFTQGLFLGTTLVNSGRCQIQNYAMLQGVSTYVPNSTVEGAGGGISCHTRGIGIYDSPLSGIVIGHTQVMYINGAIWGSGNAGHPIEVLRGGKLFYDPTGGALTLTGGIGLSDIILGTKTSGPAVDTIYPYAFTTDRAYSFANLIASVASGGFGGNMFDPLNPNTAIIIGD